MAAKKVAKGQYSLDDYRFKEVHVRLCLSEGNSFYSTTPISEPSEAVGILRDVLRELDREMVCVINLDTKLKPINYNIVSIGSINQSMVPIQNIFKSAILTNAACLIMMHNHPSGVPIPSEEDRVVTRKVLEGGKLMDIMLLDHIIVGGFNGQLYSMRQHDPVLFEDESINTDVLFQLGLSDIPDDVRDRSALSYAAADRRIVHTGHSRGHRDRQDCR